MLSKVDYILQIIQLYSYLLPTEKIGNAIMDFREKYTIKQKFYFDLYTFDFYWRKVRCFGEVIIRTHTYIQVQKFHI